MERRRFLLGAAPAVLTAAGVGAIGAQPAPRAGAGPSAESLWTKARRGVGLGTQRVLWSVAEPFVRSRPPPSSERELLVPGTLAVWHDGPGRRGFLPPGDPSREARRTRRRRDIDVELPAAVAATLDLGVRFVHPVTDDTATATPVS